MTKNPPSASQLARNERMRVAAIEGAKATAEVEANGVAVRKNMERLRALRLAREAEDASRPQAEKTAAPIKPSARKKAAGQTGRKLSDFLKAQKDSGRVT